MLKWRGDSNSERPTNLSTPPTQPATAAQVIDLTASRTERQSRTARDGDGSGNLAPTLKKGGHIVLGDYVIGLGEIIDVERVHRPGFDLRLVSRTGTLLVGLHEQVNVLHINAA